VVTPLQNSCITFNNVSNFASLWYHTYPYTKLTSNSISSSFLKYICITETAHISCMSCCSDKMMKSTVLQVLTSITHYSKI
jgi:hypothetical protein